MEKSSYTTKNSTILVVDDDEDLRSIIRDIFLLEGFCLFEAQNGQEAFEIVRRNEIDLVISDMRMPGGDGLSLLLNIRAYDPEKPIFLFMTGFASFSDQELLAKGAMKVFHKPFRQDELTSYVSNILGFTRRPKGGRREKEPNKVE